jgi:hypothetical protein
MSASTQQVLQQKGASFWGRFKGWFHKPGASAPDQNQKALEEARRKLKILEDMPEGLDTFTKQRLAELIEQVDNLTDTANGPEQKVQSSYITFILIIVPIVTALVLAYETGAFFYGGDFNMHAPLAWVQFGVAFILEAVLVAIVFEMAKARRNGNVKSWRVLFCFWLFFVITSYVGQFMYLLAIHGGNLQALPLMETVAIGLRCGACCLVDLVCAGYLGSKPKTLEKQVDELSFKSKAIRTLTESIIQLQESILASAARRKEEEQRQERRRIEDEQVARLRNMIMEAGLNALTGVRDDNTRSAW